MGMLPDKSLVILLAAPMKYMSASMWLALLFEALTTNSNLCLLIAARYLVSCHPVMPN